MNCPFYGYALYPAHATPIGDTPPIVLFPTQGNQCALIVSRHAPCRMEASGDLPDWGACILVRSMQCKEVV